MSFPGNERTNIARTVSRWVISLGNRAFFVSSRNIRNTRPGNIEKITSLWGIIFFHLITKSAIIQDHCLRVRYAHVISMKMDLIHSGIRLKAMRAKNGHNDKKVVVLFYVLIKKGTRQTKRSSILLRTMKADDERLFLELLKANIQTMPPCTLNNSEQVLYSWLPILSITSWYPFRLTVDSTHFKAGHVHFTNLAW